MNEDTATALQAERIPIILLVEDEILIRLATAENLREQGYAVLEAADAAEALSLLQAGQPIDLVISDVRMPGGMDGVSLTDAIKEAMPWLPVLLVSGHLVEGAEHRADGLLRKPYTSEVLLKTAAQLIASAWKS